MDINGMEAENWLRNTSLLKKKKSRLLSMVPKCRVIFSNLKQPWTQPSRPSHFHLNQNAPGPLAFMSLPRRHTRKPGIPFFHTISILQDPSEMPPLLQNLSWFSVSPSMLGVQYTPSLKVQTPVLVTAFYIHATLHHVIKQGVAITLPH